VTGAMTVVLDVGKTLAKLSLWDPQGQLVARRTRANTRVDTGDYIALDVEGVEAWLAETLAEFARCGPVGVIVPVAHGAAVAVLRKDRLACPPIDYEDPTPVTDRKAYLRDRDQFRFSGSPALPDGLNIGVQLHRLETLHPGLLGDGATILPWAQYWAWRLSGVAASEVTSLGCHSDLWRPLEGRPSSLARKRGWAERLAPLRRADEILGTLTPEWVGRTGLSADVAILCGLHDSNAALLAARGFPEIADAESTVLSTGTWFVAMRSPGRGQDVDMSLLDEARDCLVNVDAYGRPVPSARFMGGREIELLTGLDTRRIDIGSDQPRLVSAAAAALQSGAMVLPTLTPGVGPFPHGRGRWTEAPADDVHKRVLVCIYAALVADAALDLIGSRDRLLVEGRFAEADVFVRALAALRPETVVYASNADNDVSYGALRLLNPSLAPKSPLVVAKPLEADLASYRTAWLREAQRMEATA